MLKSVFNVSWWIYYNFHIPLSLWLPVCLERVSRLPERQLRRHYRNKPLKAELAQIAATYMLWINVVLRNWNSFWFIALTVQRTSTSFQTVCDKQICHWIQGCLQHTILMSFWVDFFAWRTNEYKIDWNGLSCQYFCRNIKHHKLHCFCVAKAKRR